MSPERWALVSTAFSAIAEADPASREQLLAQVDPELRPEVARLLADSDAADAAGLMDQPILLSGSLISDLDAPRMFHTGQLLRARFEILGLLGSGGMGEVYEATERHTGVRLAIKTVRYAYRHDEEVLRRFRTEPERAALVVHPNVCRVYEALEDKTPFFTMELLDGVPLEQHLVDSGPDATLEIALDICGGLDAVHRAGLVHRDLKTANVMLVSDPARRAVLTDFGIAREAPVAGGTQTSTGTGEFAGTLAYLAPELLEGRRATSASDIYALGVVLFRMVTGRYPFEASADLVSASMRIRRPAPSPRLYAPDIPRCWETAIAACLERDPGRRPPGALTVARLLADSGTVRLSLRRHQLAHTLTRRGALATAATVAGALAGAAGWRWWIRPPFEGRKVRILVEDFESFDPGGAFGRAIRNIVRLRLGGAPNVSVIGPDEVLKAGEELNLGTQSVRRATAKALALRLNAGARVRGTVRKVSGTYTIELRAVAPESDRELVRTEATTGDQASLIAVAERACGDLYARLTGAPA